MMDARLPDGCEAYRRLGPFTAATLPSGLLRAHALKPGCWGVLAIEAGGIDFVWEDTPDGSIRLGAGDCVVIPPERRHHIAVDGEFRLEIGLYWQSISSAAEPSAAKA
jgi:hemoglobin